MTIIDQLRPGIALMFERLGWKVEVVQLGGEVRVDLRRGDLLETRNFPMPKANSDLSEALLAWRDELQGEQA